ncbi:MAG: SWIM zinc finger domain-containing protein [Bacilli bacterium]|nr:SWIM zinc finger domain-containing protein [Bacilli bacterium]
MKDYLLFLNNFSFLTKERGIKYALEKKVIRSSYFKHTVEAEVRGSNNNVYKCRLRFNESDSILLGATCSCPVGYYCKHCAAVIYQLNLNQVNGTDDFGVDEESSLADLFINDLTRSTRYFTYASLSRCVKAALEKFDKFTDEEKLRYAKAAYSTLPINFEPSSISSAQVQILYELLNALPLEGVQEYASFFNDLYEEAPYSIPFFFTKMIHDETYYPSIQTAFVRYFENKHDELVKLGKRYSLYLPRKKCIPSFYTLMITSLPDRFSSQELYSYLLTLDYDSDKDNYTSLIKNCSFAGTIKSTQLSLLDPLIKDEKFTDITMIIGNILDNERSFSSYYRIKSKFSTDEFMRYRDYLFQRIRDPEIRRFILAYEGKADLGYSDLKYLSFEDFYILGNQVPYLRKEAAQNRVVKKLSETLDSPFSGEERIECAFLYLESVNNPEIESLLCKYFSNYILKDNYEQMSAYKIISLMEKHDLLTDKWEEKK